MNKMGLPISIIQDPKYRERRYREFIDCMKPFAQMLYHAHLYSRPTMLFHLDTGELETILDERSQKAIDHIMNERNKYIKESFPEYYNPE